MKQLIDIKLLKENNQISLTNLPEKVRNELLNFYQYIFFKYNIEYLDQTVKKLKKTDFSFLDSLKLTKNLDGNISDLIINERRNERW